MWARVLIVVLAGCGSAPAGSDGQANGHGATALAVTGNHAVSTNELATDVDACKKHGTDTALCLIAAYYDRGFIQVKIQPAGDDKPPEAFRIDEGERFRLGKLTIVDADRPADGDTLGDPAKLLALRTFETGDWFSRGRLVEFLGALKTRYQDAGYASVSVVPATNVRNDRRAVDVSIAIKRGAVTTD